MNTAVSLVEVPAVIVAAREVKLVITGAGTTVTMAWAVTEVPAAFVTVRVYVVVAAGDTLTPVPPLLIAPTLLLTLPVPLLNTAVSFVEVPAVIEAGLGPKLVIVGAGTTVSVADCDVLLKVAWMCAVALLLTLEVVTLNCALVCPAGTMTVAATCAAALSLPRVTEAPPVGAGPESVIVPVVLVPPVTVD